MRFFFLILLFLAYLAGGSLYAQEKTITGRVSNAEGQALSFANVSLFSLPDSSYIAYTSTNSNGDYTLRYKGSGEAFLEAGYMGYARQQRQLHLDKAVQTVDFTLEISSRTLTGVVVNARMLGARVKGDTIIYNLAAYTDSTERVLKDILEKLPGIEVDENGKVSAQGKSVKLLIDGKEFFLDQSQMAAKNLPANMVDGVELINNYNDIGMLSGSSAPSGISVLNISIKDSYKGRWNGMLMGGGGIASKYAGKANLFNFSKHLSMATLIDVNNTGEMAFTLNDYIQFQGIRQLLRNSGGSNRFTLDELDVPLQSFSEDVASKEGQTGAFNLSYKHPNNQLKMNAYLIANRQQQRGATVSRRWASTDLDNRPVSTDALAEQIRFNFFNSYISADYQPSEHFFISNRSMLSGQDRNINNLVSRQLQTQSDSMAAHGKVTTFDFKNYLLSMYKTKKGGIFTFDGYYRYNHRPGTISLLSDNAFMGLPFSPAAEYSAVQYYEQNIHEASFFLDYSHRLGSFTVKPQIGAGYLSQPLNAALFQTVNAADVLFIHEQEYANDTRYSNADLWAVLWLQRNVGVLRLSMGIDVHHFSTVLKGKNRESPVENRQWKLLPKAQLTVYLAANHHITVSANLAEEVRKTADLNESKVVSDYRSLTQGKVINDLRNPALNAALNYFYSNFQKGTTLMVRTSYYKKSNPLTYNYIYYSDYTASTIMESPDNSHFSSSLHFRQSLWRLPVDIKVGIWHLLRSFCNYINGVENKIILNSLDADLGFMTFTKGVLNGELGGNVKWFFNQSKLMDRTMRLLTLAPYAKLTVNAGKGWTMRASVQHYKYDANDTQRNITNLSSSVVYIPPKSKFEFELTANNILNFNKTEKITSMYLQGFFEERIIQTLPGYLMIKLTYRL